MAFFPRCKEAWTKSVPDQTMTGISHEQTGRSLASAMPKEDPLGKVERLGAAGISSVVIDVGDLSTNKKPKKTSFLVGNSKMEGANP